MKRKYSTYVIVGGLLVLMGFILPVHTVFWGPRPRMMILTPQEIESKKKAHFQQEFPEIYHFLSGDDRYEVVGLRVQRGLGGRWGKLTLRRRLEVNTNREEMLADIRSGFDGNSWRVSEEKTTVTSGSEFLFAVEQSKLANDDLEHFSCYCAVYPQWRK